tara:strand:- start:35 stop:862 length:828 start_codon:yes stop_codon:yes gene_type:complete
MLNSIRKENSSTRFNIDRVSTKKNPVRFNTFFFLTFIILLLFIFFFNQINSNKQIIILNNFLINNGFTLQKIKIFGTKNISKKTIMEIVYAENESNIFNVNLSNIYNTLNNNDWVKDLYIERILPDTIKITIEEKQPIGIWQYEMSNKIITKNGEIIPTANLDKFKIDLPIIHGEHANQNANSIFEILNTNKLFAKNIWSLNYINKRRWNLHFNQGIIVLLPSKDVLEAWNKIIKLQKHYDILNLGLTELDFRNPHKILGKINFDKNLIIHRKNL